MIDDATLKKIIEEGDPVATDREARNLADSLRADVTTKTQVRRLFGRMRQIEMNWPRLPFEPLEQQSEQDRLKYQQTLEDAYRELVLFRPYLAYQTERHKSIKALAETIQRAIPLVKKDREKMKYLARFFEAIVAYHYAQSEDYQSSRSGGRQSGGRSH